MTNNKKLQSAFRDYDSLGQLQRAVYKYVDCGPSMGATVLQPNGEKKRVYCSGLYSLGTWLEMKDQVIEICVSSIVEGCDQETDTYEIVLEGKTPAKIRKEFWDAVDEVDKEAKSIWNQTHGCDACKKHWEEDSGYVCMDGFSAYMVPVWTDCPECEGHGIII
jgi:hypothetical protein